MEFYVLPRENDGTLTWMFSDHYGTGQISVDANWGNTVQRRMTAFGEDRGTTATWHGQRGFVDGTIDESIGLTQLGARSYDASLGRFLSVDPLLNQMDSQQMHGYSYARNSPVTFTDANGLHPCACIDKGIGKNPGKGTPGHNPGPSTGSSIGTTIPGGGGGGGTIGGWGPSGGGGSSSGPTGVTPQPPYIEIDYVDPELEALDEAGHGNTPGSSIPGQYSSWTSGLNHDDRVRRDLVVFDCADLVVSRTQQRPPPDHRWL